MRRVNLLITIVFASLSLSAYAGDDQVKTGWNIGPFPAVGYSSELGFQYGAFAEIFNFGDGSTFPEYKHRLSVEASAYTKGSSIFSFGYDSKYLIPNIRTTFLVSYLPDNMMDFYGFNGYASHYDASADGSFYKVDRKYFRTYLDFQGKLVGDINWAAGLGYYSYAISPVKLKKYAGADNLYTEYLNAGIISKEESEGKHLEFRVGAVHDTRDSEADPWDGFFTEVVALASPDLFEGEDVNFGQLSITHRGYIPVVSNKLTFAYQALYQTTMFGEVPFYHLQNITTLMLRKTYSEGLGGCNSLRGMLRNRAVGAGYAMANLELRYRFLNFDFIGQKWYLALNPFVDMGQVTQQYRAEQIEASNNSTIYSGEEESLHTTVGLGGKVVMNRNFILSAEYGKALNAQDGNSSLTLGLNFLF